MVDLCPVHSSVWSTATNYTKSSFLLRLSYRKLCLVLTYPLYAGSSHALRVFRAVEHASVIGTMRTFRCDSFVRPPFPRRRPYSRKILTFLPKFFSHVFCRVRVCADSLGTPGGRGKRSYERVHGYLMGTGCYHSWDRGQARLDPLRSCLKVLNRFASVLRQCADACSPCRRSSDFLIISVNGRPLISLAHTRYTRIHFAHECLHTGSRARC